MAGCLLKFTDACLTRDEINEARAARDRDAWHGPVFTLSLSIELSRGTKNLENSFLIHSPESLSTKRQSQHCATSEFEVRTFVGLQAVEKPKSQAFTIAALTTDLLSRAMYTM